MCVLNVEFIELKGMGKTRRGRGKSLLASSEGQQGKGVDGY